MIGEIRVPHTIERLGKEARYKQIVSTLKETFHESGLVRSFLLITEHDLGKISLAFNLISPLRTESRDIVTQRGEHYVLYDPSTFDNWEDVGGPQEHMDLVMKGAGIVTRLIQEHLKPEEGAENQWQEKTIHEIKQINPYHAAAAGGLHDIGRELTHIFYSNDLMGGSILNKAGVRKDVQRVEPDERVMQVPEDQDMYEAIKKLPPEAVIIRIADEFSKRAPGTNRTLQLEDFSPVAQEAWGKRYTDRPSSGLASDNWFRRHIIRHNENAPRYFEALDKWCREATGKPLEYFVRRLSVSLVEFLPPLPIRSNQD
jgi:hypothetical protein